MKIGIFSPEIKANTIPELFGAVKGYGFEQIQFDFLSVCAEETPAEIPEDWIGEISVQAEKNGVEIAAVNGTFNMAHPDAQVRRDGIMRFEKIAVACGRLNCKLVTLCTGTRNKENMWTPHPDNGSKQAWRDMEAVMEEALLIADKDDVHLGLETEASNIVDTPQKARKLLDEMRSPRLRVIMDCANLFRKGMAKKEMVRPVIREAFDMLGGDIALAHGKDILETPGIAFTGAGMGIVDFDFFFEELKKAGYRGGVILHGIKREKDIPGCVGFIRNKAALLES
jgi:sugar phosphate isomerase/epimerase